MINHLRPAIDAATQAQQSGAELADITRAAHDELERAGEFGKSLDRNTRRVVRQVTGVRLEPGEGHGKHLANGLVIYR